MGAWTAILPPSPAILAQYPGKFNMAHYELAKRRMSQSMWSGSANQTDVDF